MLIIDVCYPASEFFIAFGSQVALETVKVETYTNNNIFYRSPSSDRKQFLKSTKND